MRPVFAIVGCGRIARRHAEQIKRVGTLAAVCDIDYTAADELSRVFGARPYYSIESLLASEPGLDVVSICTPNGLHAQHSILALKAGCHVLCEKPLSISVSDAREMIEAAQQSGKMLFVVKQNRFNPPVQVVKQWLTDGTLGRIHSFQVNGFWNRPHEYYLQSWKGTRDLDGGTLFTQFSHFVDLLYWFLGEVKSVRSFIRNFEHPFIDIEDTGVAILEMTNGAIGTLNYTVNSFQKNMEGSITLFGEKGTVKIGGQYLNTLEYQNLQSGAGKPIPEGNPANQYGFYQGSMSNHDKVYENLVMALQQPGYELASAHDGLKTVEIICQIYGQAGFH